MGMGDMYDRDGNPITIEEWGRLWESEVYRRVALTRIGLPPDDVSISTVWLGIDHSYMGEGPPIIFETMVFGGSLDQETWRYASARAAQIGHDEVVKLVKTELDVTSVSHPDDE
jgi:hypothetical protein